MIKKYLTGILLLYSIYRYSQGNKNKFMINGNILYGGDKYLNKSPRSEFESKNNYRTSAGAAHVGYFISNNFAIGILSSFSEMKSYGSSSYQQTQSSTYESINHKNAVGIFARYNHAINASKFGFFLQLEGTYATGRIKNTYSNLNQNGELFEQKNSGKEKEETVAIYPGIFYFLNSKFSVESSLGSVYYIQGTSENSEVDVIHKNSSFGASFSFTSINLGFSYYFGGKKS